MIQNGREYLNPEVCFKGLYHKQLLISVEGGQIEVIEHTVMQTPSTMSKDELKAFMVGIPSIPQYLFYNSG
jgi:hypothetical protein